MIKEIVDALTIKAEENMSKIFHNPTVPALYFLSNEVTEIEKKLVDLEEKIAWANDQLAKINNLDLILKFKEKKEDFEEQKLNLTLTKKKMDSIIASIKDFILFFIFIRRFYVLSIEGENFEVQGADLSILLVEKLKKEEQSLFREYVEGDCFSKILQLLSFEFYQGYFQDYAKKFFANIQNSPDTYQSSLLTLKAVFYECSHFGVHINADNLKLFFSNNIADDIVLPRANYELIALHCLFYYEILKEYLKLKPVSNNFNNLKESVILNIEKKQFKYTIKESFILKIKDLHEKLDKINENYNSSLINKSKVMEIEINNFLISLEPLEKGIQVHKEKYRDLLIEKNELLTNMQNLLSIVINESNIPKFLEVFKDKIRIDLLPDKVKNIEHIETNEEALVYLFHVLCGDEFNKCLSESAIMFISKPTYELFKDDISVIKKIELTDLIVFSFYFIFILRYTALENKLNYCKFLTLNVLTGIKFTHLDKFENEITLKTSHFLEKNFKNNKKYFQCKKNLLEEIKLNLEIIQDVKRILSDTKDLATFLALRLKSSFDPNPKKKIITDSLDRLQAKKKIFDLNFQKIEQHKPISTKKPERIIYIKKDKEIEQGRPLDFFVQSLNCLSENLSESLKHIEETKQDVNLIFQKISWAMDQVSISGINCLSSLNGLHTDNTQTLKKLNFSELLKLIENFLIENTLIKKDFKDKLIELISNFRLLILSLVDQVSLIIAKYYDCNSEMEKILNSFSISNQPPSKFFSNSVIKKIKPKTKELFKVYIHLKDQLNFLKKIINLFKCDTDEIRESYNIIKKLDNNYQNTYKLLNKKMRSQNGLKDRNCEKNDNQISPKLLQCIKEDIEKAPEKNIEEKQSEKVNQDIEKLSSSQHSQTNNTREHSLLTEIVKSTVECTKIKARLEGEYANKERAKADLREIISDKQYEDLMSRVDPLDIGRLTFIENIDNNQFQTDLTSNLNVSSPLQIDTLETNSYNHSQSGGVVYATPAPIMFFPAPPTIVVDTYRLESRTVFYPIQ